MKAKFSVSSPEQSKRLQRKLFQMGVEWHSGNKNTMFINEPFLFVEDDCLSWECDELFYLQKGLPELDAERFIAGEYSWEGDQWLLLGRPIDDGEKNNEEEHLTHEAHLSPLSEEIFEANKAKGFWDEERNTGECLMLMVSELSEALEADRKGRWCNGEMIDLLLQDDLTDGNYKQLFETIVKDSFEDELADALIRILDFAGGKGIDIGKHVHLKLKYNSMRGNKHGKKY